jgi:RNA polymerase sigma-70 factor (ECF subfamily)
MDSGFEPILTKHFGRVFNFAFRMTMSSEDAAKVTRETFQRAYLATERAEGGDMEPWLLRIANHVVAEHSEEEADNPRFTWDMLDDTLRSEATRTDVVQSALNPEREYMLWELKQGCMTAVVNCLSVGERVAFVLSTIIGLSEEAAARTLGIKTSAYKVRLSRARQKVQDYLAPRCEHVNPQNPCHCPSRLGVALAKGFIAPPSSAVVRLRKSKAEPFRSKGPQRDVELLFRGLPDPDHEPELLDALRAEIASGTWDALGKT